MSKIVPKKILVVKNSSLGDSIMGLGTITYLRQHFPKSYIIYAVPADIATVYQKVQTDADAIMPLQFSHKLPCVYANWKQLSPHKIDIIYEMPQAPETANLFRAYSFLKRCYSYFYVTGGKNPTSSLQLDIEGAWKFVPQKKGGKRPNYLDFPPRLFPFPRNKSNLVILGINPKIEEAREEIKNYLELAQEMRKVYPKYQIAIPLLEPHSKKFEKLLHKNSLPEGVFTLQKSLADLPEYISRARLYIGASTCMKHLAVAVGIKTITFFGSETHIGARASKDALGKFHPYDKKNHHLLLVKDKNQRYFSPSLRERINLAGTP